MNSLDSYLLTLSILIEGGIYISICSTANTSLEFISFINCNKAIFTVKLCFPLNLRYNLSHHLWVFLLLLMILLCCLFFLIKFLLWRLCWSTWFVLDDLLLFNLVHRLHHVLSFLIFAHVIEELFLLCKRLLLLLCNGYTSSLSLSCWIWMHTRLHLTWVHHVLLRIFHPRMHTWLHLPIWRHLMTVLTTSHSAHSPEEASLLPILASCTWVPMCALKIVVVLLVHPRVDLLAWCLVTSRSLLMHVGVV